MTTVWEAIPTCPHCGNMVHEGQCPRIKAIEYYENGSIKRVEYKDDYVDAEIIAKRIWDAPSV